MARAAWQKFLGWLATINEVNWNLLDKIKMDCLAARAKLVLIGVFDEYDPEHLAQELEDLKANIKIGTKLYRIIYGNFDRPVETVGRLILNIDWEQRLHAHTAPNNLDLLNLTDEQKP